jgi:uncharacterized protein (DUF302 family)
VVQYGLRQFAICDFPASRHELLDTLNDNGAQSLASCIIFEGVGAMSYYFSKTLDLPFDAVIERVTGVLKTEGFGVLTDIDVKATMQKKLGVEFRNYRILGACNPPFAHRALQAEDKIGTMLPCNVIVQELPGGGVEVAAIDPVASMQAVQNNSLAGVALQVRAKLKQVIESL